METHALGIHQGTYDAVFQHPIARNLQWREVHSMLTALADGVQEEHNGNFKFTRNGQSLTVHPPKRKDFSDIEELMQIRHFLERSDAPLQTAAEVGAHLLVVIDHREARIYKTDMQGTVPQRIMPLDPKEARRHLHNVDNNANGQRKPEQKAFYAQIARSLEGAQNILLFGSSTGASSAMNHLVAELKQHYPELAGRVVGSVVVDATHQTEAQLLAEARTFYAAMPEPAADA